jgi:hypothetical protein
MAAIAFNAAHRAEHVGERLKTVPMLRHRLLDACQLPDTTTFVGIPSTKDFTMTMLTPTRGRFEPAAYSSESRNRIGSGGAGLRLATVRRFCISALAVVMTGVALTAIMALKVIVYLPRFHH